MTRLLFIGCSKTKKEGTGPALEIYDGPVFRILRKARDEGHPLPQIVIISKKIGVVGPLTPVTSYHWDPPKGEDMKLKAQVAHTFHRLSQVPGGGYAEVYIDSSHGFAYLFPTKAIIQKLFPDATIHTFIGLKMGIRFGFLKAWLRGLPFPEVIGEGADARFKDGPAERRGRGGRTAPAIWAQPLDESVRPYIIIEGHDVSDVTNRMEAAYRRGYRLFKFFIQPMPSVEMSATLITALMTMPQGVLF